MQPEQPESDGPDVHSITTISGSKIPPKIGGILILVAIGLILSLMQSLSNFLGSLALVSRDQVWERLTTPGSIAYHPYWKLVLLFQLGSTSAIIGLNVVAVVLFFRRQRVLPMVIVITIPIIFILILIGYYLSGLIPAVAQSPAYSRQFSGLIVRFIALHVWIPYFLVSERVKKTFVL